MSLHRDLDLALSDYILCLSGVTRDLRVTDSDIDVDEFTTWLRDTRPDLFARTESSAWRQSDPIREAIIRHVDQTFNDALAQAVEETRELESKDPPAFWDLVDAAWTEFQRVNSPEPIFVME